MIEQLATNREGIFTGRPASVEDAREIHAVFAAADIADKTAWAGSWEEYVQELMREDIPLDTCSRVIVSPEGQIVAAGWFTDSIQKDEARYASLSATVHPAWRGCGVGTSLMAWFESSAVRRLNRHTDTLPRWLLVSSRQGLMDREELLQQSGFNPIRSYFKMRCDIRGELPDLPRPEGLQMIRYEPGLDSQVHAVMDEAFSEHFLYQPHTQEMWSLHTTRGISFCPKASYLVLDENIPVGASVCSIWAEDNQRAGIREGWVEILGVLKPYRGRGVASALLGAALARFKDLGMDYAGLFVDTENPTGALHLYERVGFRVVSTTRRWRKIVG